MTAAPVRADSHTLVPADELDADYTPGYIKLARVLRARIEDGTYPFGSLLPSSRQLAAEHGVSTSTAGHALQVLVRHGYARHIESKPHQVIWRPRTHPTEPQEG